MLVLALEDGEEAWLEEPVVRRDVVLMNSMVDEFWSWWFVAWSKVREGWYA